MNTEIIVAILALIGTLAGSYFSNNKNTAVINEKIKDLKEDKEINRENKIDLEKSLQSIDPQTREMIKMKYYMGYKLEEIAQILDLSIGTVKGKMYTALKNMRKELSDSENRG